MNNHHGNSTDFARLTRVLTNMFASERQSLQDNDEVYDEALRLVAEGQDQAAVDLVSQLRDEAGDRWRQRAFQCGLISTFEFSNL